MMLRPFNLILSIVIFLANLSNAIAQGDKWNLKKNRDDIIIYTRANTITGMVEFKAITIVETTIDTLLKVFKDVEGYTKWMSDTNVSKTLKKINHNEQYLYLEFEVPWPIENRDIPIYQKITRTDNFTKISLIGKPNYIPPKKGFTRVKKSIVSWEFIPLQSNRIKIIYKYMGDPGINMPSWIINLFIVEGPFKTLSNLKVILEL